MRDLAVAVLVAAMACGGTAVVDGDNPSAGGGGSGTSGSGGDGGRPGGTGGGPLDECSRLQEQYAEALAAAKICSPMLSVEQCTVLVPDRLSPCFAECPTFINPQNAQALLDMMEAQTFYDEMCRRDDCPDIVPCQLPTDAFCIPGPGGGGVCDDSF